MGVKDFFGGEEGHQAVTSEVIIAFLALALAFGLFFAGLTSHVRQDGNETSEVTSINVLSGSAVKNVSESSPLTGEVIKENLATFAEFAASNKTNESEESALSTLVKGAVKRFF